MSNLVQVESCQEDVAVVVAGHGRSAAVMALKYNFTTSVSTFVLVRQQCFLEFQEALKAVVHIKMDNF